MLEVEKKQKLNDIKSAKLTAEPPTGLTWNDIDSIKNIFHCGTETYFAEVKWTKSDTVSFIPIRLLRKFNPLKVYRMFRYTLTILTFFLLLRSSFISMKVFLTSIVKARVNNLVISDFSKVTDKDALFFYDTSKRDYFFFYFFFSLHPLKLIKMSLWADKYKPKSLDQLSYHKDLSNHLKKLVSLFLLFQFRMFNILSVIVTEYICIFLYRLIQIISLTCCSMDLQVLVKRLVLQLF